MKTEILNIETIEATKFNVETTIVTLSECPTKEEMDFLFGNDESIILEF